MNFCQQTWKEEIRCICHDKTQAMCVERNIEGLSSNRSCSGKTKSITYSECMCL
jgi:hypothetical protein